MTSTRLASSDFSENKGLVSILVILGFSLFNQQEGKRELLLKMSLFVFQVCFAHYAYLF